MVCCQPIYSGRKTCGRTSRSHTGGRSHRVSPPSFCDACLNFCREKDLAGSFPSSTVKSIFVYPRIKIVLHYLLGIYFYLFFREEKSQYRQKKLTHLDILSIPQSGGKMSKRLGGIIGCNYKTSSWLLNGFPDGSDIGSTIKYRGEAHRYNVRLHQSPCRATKQKQQQKQKQKERGNNNSNNTR